MEKPESSNANNKKSESRLAQNIILNHDFSGGLRSWQLNNCDGHVALGESADLPGVPPRSGGKYAVITNRKEHWQGLEQDITNRVSPGSIYTVTACVRVSDSLNRPAVVKATLKLEYKGSSTNYFLIGRASASKDRWEKLMGTFTLETLPNWVVFYLEGPEPGVDLLVDSVVVSPYIGKVLESSLTNNIIVNHDFLGGLHCWQLNYCDGFVASGEVDYLPGVSPSSGEKYAVTTNRKECWQGLEQDITNRLSPGSTYTVTAYVRVWDSLNRPAVVRATLRLEYIDSPTNDLFVGRASASKDRWEKLMGTFMLETLPTRAVLYLEGPEPGVDLLIDSVVVSPSTVKECEGSLTNNIIFNHDFSGGLHCWQLNYCDGFVASGEVDYLPGVSPSSGEKYAVTTNRKECWQGLEQDITNRLSPGSTYTVTAYVRVWDALDRLAVVKATLRLEYKDSPTNDLFVGRAFASKGRWEKLMGTFMLETLPNRVVLYLEGPEPGVDLLVDSVVVSPYIDKVWERRLAHNIIFNHDFSGGLQSWHLNTCDGHVVSRESGFLKVASVISGGNYVVITNRKECWQGIEQDITSRVSPGSTYTVSASVRVSGSLVGPALVKATLRLEYENSSTVYLLVGRASVSQHWENLTGTFALEAMPNRVTFYLEGPEPGVDILIDFVVVSPSCVQECKTAKVKCCVDGDENIILNSRFDDGLNNWSGRGCEVLTHESMREGKIVPLAGKFFASTIYRTQSWNGIQQEITGRVQRKLVYEVTAVVRIFGNNVISSTVRATLWLHGPGQLEEYIGITNVQASDKDWVQLQGKFLLNSSPSIVVIYLEGPPPGTDILVNSFQVKLALKLPPSPSPPLANVAFGVNVVENSNLNDGLSGWFSLGPCILSISTGSPHILPPTARDSLGPHQPLSGRCILVTNRTQTWMGPAQMITNKLKLYLTYQVSAWVRVGSGATGSQNVNIDLAVDSQWVNGAKLKLVMTGGMKLRVLLELGSITPKLWFIFKVLPQVLT